MGKKMISAKGAVDFRCNAFIDFWLQADKDEMKWLKTLFGCIAPQQLFDKKIKCILILDGATCNVSRQGVSGAWKQRVREIICSYPWTLRSDQSASLLTRDVLIHIYGQLKDPNDMWAFMRVNKLFHKAGCAYAGYAEKMAKLKAFSGVEQLPFPCFATDDRRRFFAVCFVSCVQKLEQKLVASVIFDPILLRYCYHMIYGGYCNQKLMVNLSLHGITVVLDAHLGEEKPLFGGHASRFLALRECIKKALIV
jgi:hypothetical protein